MARPEGRRRGPVGLGRSWIAVMIRPRRFFRRGIAPGEQAPGLAFAMAVVAIGEASRLWTVPGALPALTDSAAVSAGIYLGLIVLVVAPAALHLLAGLQTLLLLPLVTDRAGVSETVQLTAYATAPCVLAGLPVPVLRVGATAYGAFLLVLGIRAVHGVGWRRASLAGAIPAALAFGYGFRGFDALQTLLSRWSLV